MHPNKQNTAIITTAFLIAHNSNYIYIKPYAPQSRTSNMHLYMEKAILIHTPITLYIFTIISNQMPLNLLQAIVNLYMVKAVTHIKLHKISLDLFLPCARSYTQKHTSHICCLMRAS